MEKTKRTAFIKYCLTRGTAWGMLMLLFMILSEIIENGSAGINSAFIWKEVIWIPFGIILFAPLAWYFDQKKKIVN